LIRSPSWLNITPALMIVSELIVNVEPDSIEINDEFSIV
jgi:hypothetical protein